MFFLLSFVAQGLEHIAVNYGVVGSNPTKREYNFRVISLMVEYFVYTEKCNGSNPLLPFYANFVLFLYKLIFVKYFI